MTAPLVKLPNELIIPMTPTAGFVKWPAELDGLVPDFSQLDTVHHHQRYGENTEGLSSPPNKTFLYPWKVDLLRKIISFTAREDFAVVHWEGDLLLLMHYDARIYEVVVNPHGQFDDVHHAELEPHEIVQAVFVFVRSE